jgi:hypothetical protein
MLIDTFSMSWTKARAVNETSASFVAKIPTNTEPTGTGTTATNASVFDIGWGGAIARNGIILSPYGTGTADFTFSMRVWLWRVIGANPNTRLWVPHIAAEILCTLGTATGVAAMQVVNTEKFCDILEVVSGSGAGTSPGNNTAAFIGVGLSGCQKVEVSFATGSSATDCNALVCFM